jgi:formate dehydrogenase major subunit
VNLHGKPWNNHHTVIWYDSLRGWQGDVPDGDALPISQGGGYPFIVKSEGRGYLFGPGRPDGPFPEHYEPWESPVPNPMSTQQNNPAIKSWETAARGAAPDYPIVATTHRLVEHLGTGVITRRLPWLVELMPEMFVEIDQELAEAKGIANGDTVIVESARGGVVRAKAVVTLRLSPFQINGTSVHQISLPWNWGYRGLSKGDRANLLTPRIGDPNTGIPEFRAFLCNIRKVS